MDKKTAKRILQDHEKALKVLLESEGMGNVKAEVKEAVKSASEGSKAFKKTLIDRVKDLPVIQKVSELGTAGTIAVSTAAVAQTDLATDLTQVFIADVAQDVVEERFEVPMFIDTFVDFDNLHVWGQEIISEKVSELQATSSPSSVNVDPTPQSSASSQGTSDDTPSQQSSTEQSQEPKETESKSEESQSSNEESEETDKEDKQEQAQEQKTEDKQESQEDKSSSETEQQTSEVKTDLPIIETPIDTNDSSIRQVSPTS